MKKYEFLEHTADARFKAYGRTKEEAFSNCAYALKEVVTEGKIIEKKLEKDILVFGKDNEKLLYNFMEEFLYLIDAEDFILSKIKEIKIEKNKIKAKITGDLFSKYKISNKVKAMTYNSLSIKNENGMFNCEVVLDV
jgi:SHS2 domain-containing protein